MSTIVVRKGEIIRYSSQQAKSSFYFIQPVFTFGQWNLKLEIRADSPGLIEILRFKFRFSASVSSMWSDQYIPCWEKSVNRWMKDTDHTMIFYCTPTWCSGTSWFINIRIHRLTERYFVVDMILPEKELRGELGCDTWNLGKEWPFRLLSSF